MNGKMSPQAGWPDAALRQVFHTVADATANGRRKFSDDTMRDVARRVVCRSYGPMLLELAHLVRAAALGGRRRLTYEWLFWGSGPGVPSAYAAAFTRATLSTQLIERDVSEVRLKYPGHAFAISYGRMPVLGALMEVLSEALGYAAVNDIVIPVCHANVDADTVVEVANALSRAFYDYLKDRLAAPTEQSQFRSLTAFLAARSDNSADGLLDDDAVFGFWRANCHDDSAGFRTFDNVCAAFNRLIETVEAAGRVTALEGAHTLGGDAEAGEIDPDRFKAEVMEECFAAMDDVRGRASTDEDGPPLAVLAAPPADAVKFLTDSEMRLLDVVYRDTTLAERLPLSALRRAMFGALQRRLTAAVKRAATADERAALIDGEPGEDYAGRLDALMRLAGQAGDRARASLHVLAMAGMDEAMALLLALAPDIDLTPLHGHNVADSDDSTVHDGVAEAALARFLSAPQDPTVVGAVIAAVVTDAHRRRRSVRRDGFGENAPADAHAAGGPRMVAVARDTETFVRRAKSAVPDAAARFAADRAAFAETFRSLYLAGATP